MYLGRSTSTQIHLTQVFHTLTFYGVPVRTKKAVNDHGHLIGEEHEEMVLVAALEDRLGCV